MFWKGGVAPFTGSGGLKLYGDAGGVEMVKVAPFTGAWIENHNQSPLFTHPFSRTLHGCVD
jgi:hypothetical protein